ncbi:MAG: anaerobic glycerol-3-phosphate dehydrogenase subunit C [Anaerolineae bacterium]
MMLDDPMILHPARPTDYSVRHLPVESSIDACIKCNVCVTACPVAAVTDLFPGPKYEAPQSGRFRGSQQPLPDHSVDYCSGCRVCNIVCPTGVKIAEINARARADMVAANAVPWRNRLRNNLIARSELLGKLGQPVAPLANLTLRLKMVRALLETALGIARHAPLPHFSSFRFSRWFHKRRRPVTSSRKVVYFHGCSTEYYEPRVGQAAVYVLEANGFEVIVPPQNCCGLPLLSNGEFKAAQRYYDGNLRKLADYARQGIPIVGSSTSCTLTLKEEAPELLSQFGEEAQLLARSTYDIHEFLLQLLDAGTLKEPSRPLPLTLAYHAPCQYRAHRLGVPSVELLRLIPELQIVESRAACCGIAGTYGFKQEKYQIGMEVGRPLFEFVAAVDGPLVVCDSETCRWQITHATGVPTVHPIELLAAAYGWRGEGPLFRNP